MRKGILAGAAVVSFAAGILSSAPRFDEVVRNSFFAGFGGDRAALERSMKYCEEMLASDPKNAEARVWHGGGLVYLSGQAFQSGDRPKGIELWMRGNQEMDDAVALAPDSIAVRIPRGAVLLNATKMMPFEQARPSIEKGISDYEAAYQMQQHRLTEMSAHAKGELLFGIAEAHSRLGNMVKAQEFFSLVADLLPGTEYARRARIWGDTKALTVAQTQCVGCHVK
jgi:hypothetical protein